MFEAQVDVRISGSFSLVQQQALLYKFLAFDSVKLGVIDSLRADTLEIFHRAKACQNASHYIRYAVSKG